MPAIPLERRVIEGDALEVIPSLGAFDFIFADPPFNIGQAYREYNDRKPLKVFEAFIEGFVKTALGALAPNGIIALHGPDDLADIYLSVMRGNLSYRRLAWVNWHYRFGQCNRSNWIDSRCHCLIYCGTKATPTWNPSAVLVPPDRVEYGDKRITESENGGMRIPLSIFGIPSDGPNWGRVQGNNLERRTGHPNQLPEVYLERLLKAYTNPGDRVLDPFGGSGTTAVVAAALGRKVVTIDISPSNCESIRERLRKGAVRVK